jgi:serine/tyrosine/threonine adenylyltransferase
MIPLTTNNLFTSSLPQDTQKNNHTRQVQWACFSYTTPVIPSNPKLITHSKTLVKELWLSQKNILSEEFTDIFSGKKIFPNTTPYAMCYGGHQFGHWAGQLWDGRAINLFEVDTKKGVQTLQLKWAWPTPYSRWGDGFAVLRSSLREYMCSEAMFHLWVPTTRALSLIITGDKVVRDVMYDGNPQFEPWAIVCRVAPSFIRFGNFEIFAARGDLKTLKILLDFTIKHYFSHLWKPSKKVYIKFLQEVAETTLDMIIHWQRVGFVHGVMNTDNMSILWLTIDYGPYGFLDHYDESWTPNTTDAEGRRYRFWNQPNIALWNIVQLANALHPLIQDIPVIEKIVENYRTNFQKKYLTMMQQKLWLREDISSDISLIQELIKLLQISETDYTIFFRNLSNYEKNKTYTTDILEPIEAAFYTPQEIVWEIQTSWENWIKKYLQRLKVEAQSDTQRKTSMNQVNPKYIWRNYIASQVIEDVGKWDTTSLEECMKMLEKPYDEAPEFKHYFSKCPDWAKEKVGCSMLSCSS